MTKNLLTPRNIFIAFLLLVALLLPLSLSHNQYYMVLVTTVLLYAVLGTAWNVIGGMAGQLDLAAGAYLGLGAFTAGTLFIRWQISPWIGMVLGGFVAAAVSLLIGLPLFRFKVREVWYALSSSALVEVLRVVFLIWDDVGGPVERYFPTYDWSWVYLRFNSYVPYYYIMLGFLLIAILVNYRIRRTKLGYSLLALGEDEDAAEVVGVDSRACKLKALAIYAFMVGVTGGVYSCIYGFIHPNFFSGLQSTEVAILGIVGGLGITYGPLMAAVLLVSTREYLRATLGGGLEGLYLAIYAAVLILIALFRPRGIATLFQDVYQQLKGRFGEKRNEPTANPASK